jgi:hypothetical protein
MNEYQKALLIGFGVFYFHALGLYHFMVFRVNRQLPPHRRIRHSLFWGGWNKLRDEYKGFYPRSSVYQMTVSSAVTCLLFAAAFSAFCFWEYSTGK